MPNKKESQKNKPTKLFLVDKSKKNGLLSSLRGGQTDTYEKFYKELASVPYTKDVDIVLTTHGGSALWCAKICNILKNRTGRSRIFVKWYAHSAGTVIALTGKELYITPDTTFSAIDAQGFPFSDLLQTSIQRLSKLVNDPRNAFIEMNNERAKYFRTMIEKNLNEKLHNKELVMKNMHDDSPIHEQLFFREEMDAIGIKYKIWDGETFPKNENTVVV